MPVSGKNAMFTSRNQETLMEAEMEALRITTRTRCTANTSVNIHSITRKCGRDDDCCLSTKFMMKQIELRRWHEEWVVLKNCPYGWSYKKEKKKPIGSTYVTRFRKQYFQKKIEKAKNRVFLFFYFKKENFQFFHFGFQILLRRRTSPVQIYRKLRPLRTL